MEEKLEIIEKTAKDIIISFIPHPESVETNIIRDDQGILIKIVVDRRDMGLLIGHQGVNIQAVKLMIRLIGKKYGERVCISVIDYENKNRVPFDIQKNSQSGNETK